MKKEKIKKTNNLLLEIGVEEIPANFLSHGLNILKDNSLKIFSTRSISFSGIHVYGTPRRLVLFVNGIADRQNSSINEIRGPAKNIAFDKNNKVTMAGMGFAKKCGISANKLLIKNTDHGEYVFAVKEIKGMETQNILPDILIQIIKSLSFPKMMRWEPSNFRFPRPIRWITALLNRKVINISLAGITSSRNSFGHRSFADKALPIPDPSQYVSILKKYNVIVDHNERKKVIKDQLKNITNKLKAKVILDEGLLEVVTNLVEYPQALLGSFDKTYLLLPPQVLITVMKEQQKYFSIENNSKTLLPNFVLIANSSISGSSVICQGNEWVLRARLNDAKFFWDEDRKIPLENRIDGLKGIVFQNKLGTIYDKTKRINGLAIDISRMLNLKLNLKYLEKAAQLCKADLLTQMVNEYPNLQGIMGKEYILHQGGEPEIAQAVYEHYMPRFAADSLPETDLGAILSIADKMDNIVSFFLLDKAPSGSEDPFALRRQANGIIQIIWHKNYSISLQKLIEKGISRLKDKIHRERTEAEIKEFFLQRVRNLLLEKNIKYDCLDAVLSSKFNNILLDMKRAKTIMDLYNHKDFSSLVTSFKRVSNILKKTSPSTDFKEELLLEDAESQLFEKFITIKENFAGQIKNNDYYLCYKELKLLQGPIDNFFDNVLVMDKDKRLQQNRLNLLNNISIMFHQLADFSKIVI